jgi:hypothetical protein
MTLLEYGIRHTYTYMYEQFVGVHNPDEFYIYVGYTVSLKIVLLWTFFREPVMTMIHYVNFKGGIKGIMSLPRPSGSSRGLERSGAPREDPEGRGRDVIP